MSCFPTDYSREHGLSINLGLNLDSYSSSANDRPLGDSVDVLLQKQPDDHPSYAQSASTRASYDQGTSHSFDSPLSHAEECLSFSPPVSTCTLLDDSSKSVDILLSAQLAGLFSREGQLSDYLAPEHCGSMPYSSPVLICYRRNRISITGHLAVPRGLRCVLTSSGQQLPIVSQELVLSAFESHESGYGGRLVQTLVQRDGPPTSATDSEGDGVAPSAIQLTPEAAEEASHDQEYTIYPFEWKKLQFRRATVNNGKGPDRQRFFFVSVKILATLTDGQKVSISEAISNCIIVRGRGPQNFAKGIGSPENGKVYRSKSLNPTLDGRLRKPDRRATRNSLLRQSLSRKNTFGSGISSGSMSAYDNSASLAVPETSTDGPMTPPITPFSHASMIPEPSEDSSSENGHTDSPPPESNFKLDHNQSTTGRPTGEAPSMKLDLEEIFKQTFDVRSSNLHILTPPSPARQGNTFDARTNFHQPFGSSEDVARAANGGFFAPSAAHPQTSAMTGESPPVFPPTPMTLPEEDDRSGAVARSAPSMDLSYLDHPYGRGNTFMMNESSSAPSMGHLGMASSNMVPYASMQDSGSWPPAPSMAKPHNGAWSFR